MSELNDDMWEQIELNNYGKGKLIHIVNEQAELIRVMHDQLQQAHRAGWEQAKAECEAIALDYEQKVYDSVGDPRVGNFTGRIARLIADMEYKEAKDETN